MRTVGSTQDHNRTIPKTETETEKIIQTPSNTKKPESVFIQDDVTSIGDIFQDVTTESNSFLDDLLNIPKPENSNVIFNNENNQTNDMTTKDLIGNESFEIIPSNFRISNGRILGTVNVKSTEKTYSVYRLHLFFSPLDLKKKIFGQKINDLYFKEDFSETIEINEDAKNYKNITVKIHVMTDNGKVMGQEKFIDVLENDSTDMPVKIKSENTTKYIIAGLGVLGLILLVRRIRKK